MLLNITQLILHATFLN